MKTLILFAALVAFPVCAHAVDKPESWTEVFDSPEGRYSIDYNASSNDVGVTKLDDKTVAPSAVKLRIKRKNEKPLVLKLRTLETPSQMPIRYTGHFNEWNGSVAGLEVEMSFDKKTWKKVKRFFGAESSKK